MVQNSGIEKQESFADNRIGGGVETFFSFDF